MDERIKALQEELQNASDSYYNYGTEIMSNKEYDAKFDELKKLEEEAGITDGFTSRVGSEASGKLPKVKHEYEAKSLGKTKDADELIAAQQNYPGEAKVCLSWKMDGSTAQATYLDGKLVMAATRGDGSVGQNIMQNVSYIQGLPQEISCSGKLVVRGEVVMSYAEFDRLNTAGQFANPRNLCNATITAMDTEVLKERETCFKAFEVVYADEIQERSFGGKLDALEQLSFGVVEHKVIPLDSLKAEIAEWSKEKRILGVGFPVDGLVIANDDTEFTKGLVGTEHHPHLAKGMAFKWQDETAETILRDIEWSPSRTGLLNPVAIFDTVALCGTKVSRASLHNISYMDDLDLRIGDKITVYKANMIIPQLDKNLDAETDRSAPLASHSASCPCCKAKAVVTEPEYIQLHHGMQLRTKPSVSFCPNEKCPAKELGRLTHFVSKHGMNIDGLSEKTLNVLMNAGLVAEPADLYTLKDHKDELLQLEGFAEKGVNNLLAAIEKSKTCDFAHFMYAQGIPGFGRGQIKPLQKFIEDTMSDSGLPYIFALTGLRRNGTDFTQIDGIGTIMAEKLNNWIDAQLPDDPQAETRLTRIMSHISFENMTLVPKTQEQPAKDSAIAGKSFCITGSLESFANRDACVAFIEQNGGKFVSGVSKKTDYLVNNDITSTSGKNKKAKELGVPIITEQMLINASEGAALPEKQPVKSKGVER